MERDKKIDFQDVPPHHNLLSAISFVKGFLIGFFILGLISLGYILENQYSFLEKFIPEKKTKHEVLSAHDIVSYTEIQSNLRYVMNDGAEVLNGMTISGDIEAPGSNLNLADGNITAANIIYSLTAGDGIEITGGQNPTISASITSGVTSIENLTGAIDLDAGSNISLAFDGNKITISSSISDTNTTYTAGDDLDLSDNTFSLENAIDVTEISLPSNGIISFGGVALGSTGGSGLIGVNTAAFDNSTSSTLQDVLADLDASISSVGGGTTSSQWTDPGIYIYPTNSEFLGNNAVGGSNKIVGLFLADNSPLVYGTNNDFRTLFNGSNLILGDTSNTFLSIGDSGSTANFNFNQNQFYIRGDGFIGIGNSNPNYALDVSGSIRAGTDIYVGSVRLGSTAGASILGANTSGFLYSSASTIQQVLSDLDTAVSNLGAGSSGVWLDGGSYIYVNAALANYLGNNALGGSNKLAGAYFSDNSLLSLGTDNDYRLFYDGNNLILGNTSNTFLSIGDSGSTANFNFNQNQFYIRGDGNVGINTTSPIATLDVNGNISTSGNYQIGGTTVLANKGFTSIMVGFRAGENMPVGADYNTLLGYYAGQAINNTSGENNTLIGAWAGSSITTGTFNSIIGSDAGMALTTGFSNSLFGAYSEVGSTSSYNAVLGYDAAGSATGNYNLILGAYSDVTSWGGYNTVLGPLASSAFSSSIVIGSYASATASHQLVLGGNNTDGYINDVYIGRGVQSATSNDVTINATGGSGSDIAGSNLTLAGGKATGNADGGDIIFSTSNVGSSGSTLQSLSEKMRLTDEGNLAIGLTNTLFRLDVAGNIRAGTDLYIGSIAVGGTAGATKVGVNTGALTNVSIGSSTVQLALQNLDSAISTIASGTSVAWTDGGVYLYPTSNESIGNPLNGISSGKINGLYLADNRAVTFGTQNNYALTYIVNSGLGINDSDGNSFMLVSDSGSTANINFNNNQLYLRGDGNVGIGRTNPAYTLDVAGALRVGDSAIFMNVGLTADNNQVLTLDGNGRLRYIDSTPWDKDSSNDLTTSTQFTGDVSGLYNNLQIGATAVGANELENTTVVAGSYGGVSGTAVYFPTFTVDADGRLTDAGTSPFIGGINFELPLSFQNGLTRTGNNINLGGSLTANTRFFTAGTEVLYMTTTGNVGIGTTSPSYKLDVSGVVRSESLLTEALVLSQSYGNILTANGGFDSYTNFTGGIGTGGKDSILGAQRLTSTGNLINIGSYQGGEMLLTKGGTFAAKVDYATGTQPDGVDMADFNGDGNLDIVTSNYGSVNVSVLLNNGNGTFASAVNYSVGGAMNSLAVGDLNGDGFADIITANNATDNVSVLLNNRDGTFASAVNYSVGDNPFSVTAGDINADGNVDIIAANNLDDDVSVLINNGNGTFAAKVDYPAGPGAGSVEIGDFNGDGWGDLAVVNDNDDTVSVLMNNGNGTFATNVDYTTPSGPYAATVADLNGDQKADIAVASISNFLSVFINNGDGTFAAKVDYGTGTGAVWIASGDLDGNGNVDLATVNYAVDSISVFMNNGDGTFATKVDYSTGDEPLAIAIGHLNDDGKADIAVTNFNDNDVSIFINQLTPIFYAQTSTGNVGIGTTAVDALMTLYSASSDTAFQGFSLDWIPSDTVTLSGDLFSINIGPSGNAANLFAIYDNNSKIFSVSEAQIESAAPHIFTAAGDVSMSYDLYLTNATAGYINFEGAGYIRTTHPSANNNLTLSAANLGKVIVDDYLAVAMSTTIGSSYTGITAPTNGLLVEGSVGIGTTGITSGMTLDVVGNIRAGTDVYIGNVALGATAGATRVGFNPAGLSYIGAGNTTVQSAITALNTQLGMISGSTSVSWTDAGAYLHPTTASDVIGNLASGGANKIAGIYLGDTSAIVFGASNNFDLKYSGGNLVLGDTSNTFLSVGDSGTTANFKFNNTALFIRGDGNVGIGTTSINDKLEVAGGTTIGSGYVGGTIAAPTNGLLVQGNVGIGTTLPAYKLDVAGSAKTWDIITNNVILSALSTSLINAYFGHDGYTSFSGGIGTGGFSKDSILAAQRITSSGNLINIGSIQGGQMLLTSGGTFTTKVDYTVGSSPDDLRMSDVNGDGYLDLVVANSGGSNVSVLMNNRDGTFATKVDYTTGASPSNIVVGDLNGDAAPDIITINGGGTNTLSVLLNNGNGTFATKVDYASGSNPSAIAIGDLNGDGKADIAITSGSGTMSVYMNNGDGTLAARVNYTTASNPAGIAIGDLNGDSKADIVTTNYSSVSASVFINNGNGTFATKVDYTTAANPLAVVIGDVNGDRRADIVTSNDGANSISVLINNGDGTFATKVDYATGTQPRGLGIADITGDGLPDLVASNVSSTSISVFINNGNGTFATKVDYAAGTSPVGVALGDVNGDGKPDIAVTNSGTTTVSVFINIINPVFYAQANGNIGIGTTNAQDSLKVIGSGGTFGTSNYLGAGFTSPVGGLLIEGNVNIGITGSNTRLGASLRTAGGVVIGASGPTFMSLGVTAPANGLLVQGNVNIGTTAGSAVAAANGKLRVAGGAVVGTTYANFTGATAPANGLLVQGRVAIGTSLPANGYMLDVGGSVQLDIGLTGSFALCMATNGIGNDKDIRDCSPTASADYMEFYSTTEDVERGDLLVAGDMYVTTTQGDRVIKLKKSTQPYQASLIGIASNPDEAGDFNSVGHNIKKEDNPYPVALSGRVKVKVTAENGAIKTGDLVTASSTPGYAMRATEAGLVVGQALEDWSPNSGTNMVMVFVKPIFNDPDTRAQASEFNIARGISDYELERVTTGKQVNKFGAFDEAYIANLTTGKIDASEIVLSGIDLSTSLNGLNIQLQGVEAELSFLEDLPDWQNLIESRIDAIEDRPEFTTKEELVELKQIMEEGLFDLQTRVNDLMTRVDNLEKESSNEAEIAALTDRVSFIEQMLFGKEASNSAQLASLIDPTENPDGEVLGITDDRLELEELVVSGKTNLFDVGVVGDMSIGQLVIRGQEAAINSLALPLQIQSESTADIEFMGGKVVIDTSGNVTIQKEVTVQKLNVDMKDKDSASIGIGNIKIGETAIIIENKGVTKDSTIFLTPTTETDIPIAVIDKIPGKSFTVKMTKPALRDIKFNWWIVN